MYLKVCFVFGTCNQSIRTSILIYWRNIAINIRNRVINEIQNQYDVYIEPV